MIVPALARSLPARAARSWRSLRLRTRVVLALVAVATLSGSWFLLRELLDPWPARAVLKTPFDTWPLAFSPDGRTFVTSGQGEITSWDVATGRKGDLWTIQDDQSALIGEFSPDGRTFAAATISPTKPNSIELIETATGRTRASLPVQLPGIWALRFVDDGQTLRAFLGDGTDLEEVVTWDVETGRELSTRPLAAPTKGHIVAISADGRTMAIGGMRKRFVELWDLDVDRSLGSVMNPKLISNVTWGGVGLSADGRALAVAREDGTIEIWDVSTHSLRSTLKALPSAFTASGLKFSPDGRTLAADIDRTRETSIVGQIHKEIRRALGWRREENAEVFVLDLATGRRLARAPKAIHPRYSPDGRTIATRELDLSVKLRNVPGPSK
jgi:WD40 repeat protein